ncbi:Helix-turn-helix domain protein [compost metagenome]
MKTSKSIKCKLCTQNTDPALVVDGLCPTCAPVQAALDAMVNSFTQHLRSVLIQANQERQQKIQALEAKLEAQTNAHQASDSPKHLTTAEVCEMVKLKRQHLWRLIRAGKFPAGIPLGEGPNAKKVWPEAEILAWLDSRGRGLIGKTTA